jgi:branched-chain amino acid transport system substrate-binding protein
MKRVRLVRALVALATMAGLFTAAVGTLASPASAAGSPITITYVSSLTGPAASQYKDSELGFQARIDLQNAKGGVNGHKLVGVVIDDGTSPTNVVTGVQNALSKGSIGIVANSPVFFEAAKYAQQAGVPVTGAYTDGPEWGEQPNTNMFASDRGSENPKSPVNTLIGKFLRAHGGTVVGTYGYGVSPQSAASAAGNAQSFKLAGGKVGVLDTSVPFGSVAFTTQALVAKSKAVNALVPSLDDNSNYALATALTQAGVKLKAVLYATGYEPAVIGSPVWQALQGSYFMALFRPFSLPNAGTVQMASAMQKYAHFTKNQFPTFSQYEAWLGADLMIKGIQLSGSNPTSAKVIKNLRSIKSYNGNGLLPMPINYSTVFGHDIPECVWIMKAQKSGFTPISAQTTCGVDVPGTSTESGS